MKSPAVSGGALYFRRFRGGIAVFCLPEFEGEEGDWEGFTGGDWCKSGA